MTEYSGEMPRGQTVQTVNVPPLMAASVGGATVQTVNARDLHAYLQNGDHFATWIKDRIDQFGFVEEIDFTCYSEISEKGGRPRQEYALTIDMAKELSMLERNERGKEARLHFIACEKMAKRAMALPNFDDPIDAAEAWIAERKARQIAERTKAEIGSRREATAMATASVATRRANRLQIELDQHQSFATVKRMEKAYKGRSFNWRTLKTKSLSMGIPFEKVPDKNYGEVNSYHADIWREVYGLEIPHGEVH